jgi:hypothetical protein
MVAGDFQEFVVMVMGDGREDDDEEEEMGKRSTFNYYTYAYIMTESSFTLFTNVSNGTSCFIV